MYVSIFCLIMIYIRSRQEFNSYMTVRLVPRIEGFPCTPVALKDIALYNTFVGGLVRASWNYCCPLV